MKRNDFANKILLYRLNELKVNNSFLDMFISGLIGLILGDVIVDQG